ncbi:MAG: precorrin-6A reductase [Euryarchaeota archaeon]|nr:precorrin-6A reductase [Euryarchaeota archaeon]
MVSKVLVFAGTTEGRMLAEVLGEAGVRTHICVATDYGKDLIKEYAPITISAERMDANAMQVMMNRENFDIVIDATHPYAIIVSDNIKEACSQAGIEYLRLLRPEGRNSNDKDLVWVSDVQSAVEYLKGTVGNVLVTTGSKELSKFTVIDNYEDRIYARVLSIPSVAEACAKLGFKGKNVISMQGPFSEELNYGMLKQINAAYLVTKDSGSVGGFEEKVRAAKRAGVKIILIGRPPGDTGMSYSEVLQYLEFHTGKKLYSSHNKCQDKRKITLAGIGMGSRESMALGVIEACKTADLIIGARRMLDTVDLNNTDTLIEYQAPKILEYLDTHPEYRDIVILYSGDVGFHSGARQLLEHVDRSIFELEVKCGIPSVAYLCSRLEIPWQDVFLMSAHGCEANISGEVRRNERTFTLLDGEKGVRDLCLQLQESRLDEVVITIGQNLSYNDEIIITGRPREIIENEFRGLCVALIYNPDFDESFPIGIRDEDFIRGSAPMTKSEVRILATSKLKLTDRSIVYDIGAGTGSVSIEMARIAVNGAIYAIEKNSDSISLIEANKKKFGTPNVKVVKGLAPESMYELPTPTHAFIGGSSGNMREIIATLLEKNPQIRIVISAITLETINEVIECIEEFDLLEEEIINISISRAKLVGKYHLMTAQNPVHLIVCSGKGIS